ncbi:MAG: redox-regulated ATPase YchF [Lentisphaerae bacterium]|nr:redox-regulated ATPase YchF [Lentisphaerota bacterium]
MSDLSCGIIGLPNAGKSTLFNALTRAGAEVAPYPFCTIAPNIGVVPVKDRRVDRVAELAGVSKVVYHHVEYVDVAGLVEGASKGAGRGNQFLETIRNCHALVHAVRCFDDPNVAHVRGAVNPVEDARTVNVELILSDLQTCERAMERFGKRAPREPEARAAHALLERAHAHLNGERPVRTLESSGPEHALLDQFRFLTARRVLYAANIDEADLPDGNPARVGPLAAMAEAEGNATVPICAKIEDELGALSEEEQAAFLRDMGLSEPGLQRLVRATTRLLGLVTFITFNANEARAWTVPAGTRAQDAAGVIHSDFAKHFVRAEVTAFEDFKDGGEKLAREKGHLRIEGRDYAIRDGDVIYFRVGV